MGIGKSGHIGQKIAATLSSTGTKSVFIHPTEAAHGDMGLIGKEDIVILISNSGETDEIINIMPSIKRLSKLIASISSNQMSTMAKSSDIAIFTKDDFASSHPAGKLGRKLITRVSDLMHKGNELPKVSKGTLLTNALLEMSEKKLGVTLVNSGDNIIGIFSDGDLRRCINNSINIDTTYIEEVMTKNFIKISSDELAIDAAKLMEENKIFVLAVESSDGEIVGILSMHDLIQARII
jgi:arabinose-5-phosphate isomerase